MRRVALDEDADAASRGISSWPRVPRQLVHNNSVDRGARGNRPLHNRACAPQLPPQRCRRPFSSPQAGDRCVAHKGRLGTRPRAVVPYGSPAL
eukprot:scaffold207177_cov33-Prasinocladus_malaysianus.AAC.1